jgi:hypothetical protein
MKPFNLNQLIPVPYSGGNNQRLFLFSQAENHHSSFELP